MATSTEASGVCLCADASNVTAHSVSCRAAKDLITNGSKSSAVTGRRYRPWFDFCFGLTSDDGPNSRDRPRHRQKFGGDTLHTDNPRFRCDPKVFQYPIPVNANKICFGCANGRQRANHPLRRRLTPGHTMLVNFRFFREAGGSVTRFQLRAWPFWRPRWKTLFKNSFDLHREWPI